MWRHDTQKLRRISDSPTSGNAGLYPLGYNGLHSVSTLKKEHFYRHPFIEYAAEFMEHKNQIFLQRPIPTFA
jgi:hypothetical protein